MLQINLQIHIEHYELINIDTGLDFSWFFKMIYSYVDQVDSNFKVQVSPLLQFPM